MDELKRVGLIGLGAMGRPMARHLMAKGFTVFGYDPVATAQEKALLLGVTLESTPADVARESQIVLVVVGFDSDVERAFFNKCGLMEAARPGLIIAIGSTIAPSYARELATRIEGSGIELIDMPLTRGEGAAEAGKMLVLGGGDPHVFERCKPVFATFASDVFHLGPFGAGQVGKMVNNMMLWACMAATDEGLRFAEKMNVDREKLREALGHSSAQNWSMTTRAEEKPTPWAEKDMMIAMQEADNVRMSLPLSGIVRELIKDFKIRMNYPTPKVPK